MSNAHPHELELSRHNVPRQNYNNPTSVRGHAKDLTIPNEQSREFAYLARRLKFESPSELVDSIARRMAFAGELWSLAPPPVCGQKTNDPAHAVRLQSKESVRLPLIRADSEPFPGDTAAKDFVVRLPEHVSFQAGCELRLDLYPSLEILPRLCTITASINGKRLSGATVESKNLKNINALRIRVRFPVPEESLIRDWNRISVRFVLRKLAADAGNTQEPGMWTIRRSAGASPSHFRAAPLLQKVKYSVHRG